MVAHWCIICELTGLQRRETLLMEVQTRNKVGGILDRRLGEDDPNMTAEERNIERFTKERSRKKGGAIFDLEDGEGEDLLTHGGQTLDLNDDYDARSLEDGSDEDEDEPKKRKWLADENGEVQEDGDAEPDRKKSKQEVMDEVIKKSKLFKYERQKAKEDDDEVRRGLDQEFETIQSALGAFQRAIESRPAPRSVEEPKEIEIHPDRVALMNGEAEKKADTLYDEQLSQIRQDQRAKPTDRIKTEEEKAKEAEELAKDLADKRMKRMLGQPVEDDSEDDSEEEKAQEKGPDEDGEDEFDDAAEFGLTSAKPNKFSHTRPDGIDDEDDFLIEDDFIASGSDQEIDDEALFSDESESEDELLAANEAGNQSKSNGTKGVRCPSDLNGIKDLLLGKSHDETHESIRNIRLQYDPALDANNKEKLAKFSTALVEYLAEMPDLEPCPSPATIDVVIRHIHSMARKSPELIALAFKAHLQVMHEERSMTANDLVILTAIGSIFPPSDHFHPIITPAILLMTRWLGLTKPEIPQQLTTGAYLCALCLKYQSFAKRYIPELIRFTTLALSSTTKPSLLEPHISNLSKMADLWSQKSAFIEIFSPSALSAISSLKTPSARKLTTHITVLLSQSRLARRPLNLHNHRPLAIKSFVPKFEEGFDPRKHYDPDAERAESTRLRKEYKREKKGAMRELRKDANFMAREQLREKKERDRNYEEKYKRLVAEIQGEEGHEKKEYEKVRKARKSAR